MDNNRFDDLTRGIAQRVSRREALKLFVAAIAGIGASSMLKLDGEELTIGTQTAAAQLSCADNNIVSLPCDQYYNYLRDCGVMCADGERLYGTGDPAAEGPTGQGCTTAPTIGYKYVRIPQIRVRRIGRNRWVVPSTTVSWQWYWSTPPIPAYVKFTPTDTSPCCGDLCKEQFIKAEEQVKAHEQGHVDILNGLRQEYNNEFKNGIDIGPVFGTSRENTLANFRQEVRLIQRAYKKEFFKRADIEPDIQAPIINCGVCKEADTSEVCCAGRCLPESLCSTCMSIGCDGNDCCDPTTNTCVDKCPDCQTCQSGVCVPVNCGDPCLVCQNNSCQPKCDACSTCSNGVCIPKCGECSHCENGVCSSCKATEHCCDGQCINLSEYKCCGSVNANFVCPSDRDCCGTSSCCNPKVEQCCGGVCVPYSASSCVNCHPCGTGQVCCIGPEGQVYGCDDANSCP
jgi:hypothetical protein